MLLLTASAVERAVQDEEKKLDQLSATITLIPRHEPLLTRFNKEKKVFLPDAGLTGLGLH